MFFWMPIYIIWKSWKHKPRRTLLPLRGQRDMPLANNPRLIPYCHSLTPKMSLLGLWKFVRNPIPLLKWFKLITLLRNLHMIYPLGLLSPKKWPLLSISQIPTWWHHWSDLSLFWWHERENSLLLRLKMIFLYTK